MDKKTRKLLSRILLVVFLVSTSLLIRNALGYGGGEDDYSDAAAMVRQDSEKEETPTMETVAATMPAQSPEEPVRVWVPAAPEAPDPKMESLQETDLDALRKVNEDVLGWIHIPGSKIDYPILQGENPAADACCYWGAAYEGASGI